MQFNAVQLIVAVISISKEANPVVTAPSHNSIIMTTSLPEFSLPWSKLEVPTLGIISRIAAKTARKNIYEYSSKYSSILMQHLSNETEVQVVNGVFSEDSEATFLKLDSEMKLLQ